MKRIVIVGGGSAGWMTAIAIASRFPEKRIIVIDPKAMSPIGVGESVTGVVIAFVTDPLHGLSKGDFFRSCDVTFKTGIWYRGWQGSGTEYLAPIDSPPKYLRHQYVGYTEEFYASVAADGARLGDIQLFAQLMRRHQTDHYRNADGSVSADAALASCHFDALKFGAWLRQAAVARENVEHVDGVIETVNQSAESGLLESVRTTDGRDIEGDFFIDCTGFHRSLLARVFAPRWISYAQHIKVDSAIPSFADYTPGESLPSYTMATAMPHGWMWQIPTQSRFGRGYVFSSRHVSDEQAVSDFRAAGGQPSESPRILRFEPGRFEKQWVRNVCAIGLAGVFSEPLEASTIHGIYAQIRLLTELFLPGCTRDSLESMAGQYNRLVSAAYDDYVDFISFHYHTGRSDTEFWSDYQKPEAMTPRNEERREVWRHAFPKREDFSPHHTERTGLTTGLVIWAPMLCGMGLLNQKFARRVVELSRVPDQLRENVRQYIQSRNRILATALSHEEAIAYNRAQT